MEFISPPSVPNSYIVSFIGLNSIANIITSITLSILLWFISFDSITEIYQASFILLSIVYISIFIIQSYSIKPRLHHFFTCKTALILTRIFTIILVIIMLVLFLIKTTKFNTIHIFISALSVINIINDIMLIIYVLIKN